MIVIFENNFIDKIRSFLMRVPQICRQPFGYNKIKTTFEGLINKDASYVHYNKQLGYTTP